MRTRKWLAGCFILMLLLLTGCGEEKETYQLGNWEYILWEDTGTMEVTAFLEQAEEIPFRDLPEGISNVVIGPGITAVPEDAFSGCENLQRVTIPKTVRSIGARAFGQCKNLSQVDLSEGLLSIGDNAFLQCKSLTEIQIPDSVTSMGENPFRSCPTEIRVSDGNSAFSVVDGVLFDGTRTRLLFCPTAKTGDYAIPQGVTEIGTHAFANCNDLTAVTIPASVVSIEGNPFDFAQLELKLAPENLDFSLIDGVLFDKTGTKLLVYPCGRPGDTYEVPEGTTEIGAFAFAGCQQISKVTIPESVMAIASDSFWNCENLRLYVWDESYAQQYAREHRMDFFYILPDMGPETDKSDMLD